MSSLSFLPTSTWVSKSSTVVSTAHDRGRRVVAVAADPSGDLGVRLRSLRRGVATDQLHFIEQHDPPAVAGRLDQAGDETEPLARQVTLLDRRQPVRGGRARLLEPPPQVGDRQRVAGPEADDPVGELLVAPRVLVQEQGRREPAVHRAVLPWTHRYRSA